MLLKETHLHIVYSYASSTQLSILRLQREYLKDKKQNGALKFILHVIESWKKIYTNIFMFVLNIFEKPNVQSIWSSIVRCYIVDHLNERIHKSANLWRFQVVREYLKACEVFDIHLACRKWNTSSGKLKLREVLQSKVVEMLQPKKKQIIFLKLRSA